MIAVDTEASYSKELSIGTHGPRGYVEHPDTDHFMCSIYDLDTGLSYVGPPKDAPWGLVRGQEVCAHNYSYDRAVLREYERRGFIPFPLEEKGFCTANLAVYLQAPRSLAGASQELLGSKVSKEARDKFKGKSYHDLSPEVQQEIRDYALTDAKLCWHLWKQFGKLMPEPEVRLSAHTTMMGARGVAVDMDAVEAGISTYKQTLWEIAKGIPWADTHPITSPIQLKSHCRLAGIPVPESTAVADEGFQLWAEKYSPVVPFVAAVQRYRSVNRALTVLEAMKVRTHDGRVRYGLKYFGANHTGRWSGDSGLNVQNLPRDPLEGVALRPCLQAAAGKVLIVADYSQIEARVSVWYAEDKKQLALIRNGMCVYESHARSTLGFNSERTLKEEAKDHPDKHKLRQYAKARVLGLGFGLGKARFQAYAKTIAGLDLTAEESEAAVKDFRAKNPGIVRLWKRFEALLATTSREADNTFYMTLPSGRTITYWDVTMTRDGIFARKERGGHKSNLYGGKLVENLVQSTAREIFAAAILRVEDAGYPVVLHVHDEIVCEVPEEEAEEALRHITELMTQSPFWAAGLPINVEATITVRYEK